MAPWFAQWRIAGGVHYGAMPAVGTLVHIASGVSCCLAGDVAVLRRQFLEEKLYGVEENFVADYNHHQHPSSRKETVRYGNRIS